MYGFPGGLTTSGSQRWTQDTSGVLGATASSDQLGFALAAGGLDGDGVDDLVIGIPSRAADGGVPTWVGLVQLLRGVNLLFADGCESGGACALTSTAP